MTSYTIHQLLDLFEAHLHQYGPDAGQTVLHFSPEGIHLNEGQPIYRKLQQEPASNLTLWESHRLQVLDRKAKGSWLSHAENEEFEHLLALQASGQAATATSQQLRGEAA